ncbi:MAG: four helix bundle protein [Bacteroidales bacterium]|nr:four helix bundle protein [Bacteroidales bacterium]
MKYRGHRDLAVYKKSYDLAIEITGLSKSFPREEKYSLVDQIRRSSRSIPANVVESWAKRIYIKSFVSKIIDAYGEELETEMWLDMAMDFGYINKENP